MVLTTRQIVHDCKEESEQLVSILILTSKKNIDALSIYNDNCHLAFVSVDTMGLCSYKSTVRTLGNLLKRAILWDVGSPSNPNSSGYL
jgi:hypothetical protein